MHWTASFIVLFIEVVLLQAKLVFRSPLHEPRIYERAPPNVHVTTVHAYDPESPRKQVTYNLLNTTDHTYFKLDRPSGNLTTARTIDRVANELYHVMVAAISREGEAVVRRLQITVTEFNQFAPQFEKEVYYGGLHVNTQVDTPVLSVRAYDDDPEPYNAEVYYIMHQNASGSSFAINPTTGQLTLIQPLQLVSQSLKFGVFAEDGGSPKRWAHTNIEIAVKTISEPQEVRAIHVTEFSVEICWTAPRFGDVSGYLIKLKELGLEEEGGVTKVNVTTDSVSKCTTARGLKPRTEYQFQVFGWNSGETGLGSQLVRFQTKTKLCQVNICQNGICHVINDDPGCECHAGYYGDTCDQFDPCSASPCENLGTCHHIGHNQYYCECSPGFSDQDCTRFNPCAIHPSPCVNGGTCDSSASHSYHCSCPPGYIGQTCQTFDPCFSQPCLNGGACRNTSAGFSCECEPGYEGSLCELEVNECDSGPCLNGGHCIDELNSFRCNCSIGYSGKRCELAAKCPNKLQMTKEGVFHWNATSHGQKIDKSCPYGSIYSSRKGFARKRCKLLRNGNVAWGNTVIRNCREEGFRAAEQLTGELESWTQEPNNLSTEILQEATRQIKDVVAYAVYDQKIAHSMLGVISNMLAVNESVLEEGDTNGTTSIKIVQIVDKFASGVKLKTGERITLETENIAISVLSWDPARQERDGVTFNPKHPSKKQRNDESEEDDVTSITIPLEALELAESQQDGEIRVKFVAYTNDKFFRSKKSKQKEETYEDFLRERKVLQASVDNITLVNLTELVVYTMPSSSRAVCVYWKPIERIWSTEGLTTNQTGNITVCTSNHMTAFSVLLDPMPDLSIPDQHQEALSIITYLGCAVSILGLSLTIITYSMFRCLNRDHSGKILLNLCLSMFLMNTSFLAGSQRGLWIGGVDVCVGVAVLIHYFLLTSLAWMCVEAINMYHMLIYVFASTETHFMLKRCLVAWGVPFLIVGVTIGVNFREYGYRNEFCMLSPANPYTYYLSFLGPSCLILLVNLTIFVLVTRVLFTPRMTARAGINYLQNPHVVTIAQVRGAFTVMTLLGVTWVFGAFAVGKAKLVFQYIFCIANSLQGFLIFVVRCLQYPEAKSAWLQLIKTGTLKKYRGLVPPGGSWYASSNSNQKQNGHKLTNRMLSNTSTDTTSTVVFNSNFWSRSSNKSDSHRILGNGNTNISRLSSRSKTLKDTNVQKEEKFHKKVEKLDSVKPISDKNTLNEVSNKTVLDSILEDENDKNGMNISSPFGCDENGVPLESIGFIDEDESSRYEEERVSFTEPSGDESGYQSSSPESQAMRQRDYSTLDESGRTPLSSKGFRWSRKSKDCEYKPVVASQNCNKQSLLTPFKKARHQRPPNKEEADQTVNLLETRKSETTNVSENAMKDQLTLKSCNVELM